MIRLISREAERQAVTHCLDAALTGPSALLIEGDAGIGKTAIWVDALAQARERGFRVLAANPSRAETTAAYAGLADLLSDVEPETWADLPAPQRLAIDHILLQVDVDRPATAPRAVAAAFLSVIKVLVRTSPVLITVDDAQWLDDSSAFALAFAGRRTGTGVALILTARTGTLGGATWLEATGTRMVDRITLPPLSTTELTRLLHERASRSLDQTALRRINDISGGNPFYALELARAEDVAKPDWRLPTTLSDLVRARLGDLDDDLRQLLLVAAAAASPTVELIAEASGTSVAETVRLLERAEDAGIVQITGNSVAFEHPLIAHGVYGAATPAARRSTHRRLADAVDQPELRARHLALGATTADPDTVAALDAAAELASARGAPAAAAELLDHTERLGARTPERQILAARYHFSAGNAGRARTALDNVIRGSSPGRLRAQAASLLAPMIIYGDGFSAAADFLERFLPDADGDAPLLVQMLISLAFALVNAGRHSQAVRRADEAVERAGSIEPRELLGSALSMRVMLGFLSGEGVDEPNLQRALALETKSPDIPLAFRSSVQTALLSAYSGDLDFAERRLRAIELECLEAGEEGEWIFLAFQRALVEMWRGNFAESDRIARATMDRAEQSGDDVAVFTGLLARSALAAYAGRLDEARATAHQALDIGERSGSLTLGQGVISTLGFVELSIGNYRAAAAMFEPAIESFRKLPRYSEIAGGTAIPDAIEALIQLDRLDEAEELLVQLEANARRLDRPWMLAVALRCRSMSAAAHGDLSAAVESAQQALIEHDRVPMPFERARTQLLLGQLQRRQRQKQSAAASLSDALETFERLGTPLWAERARADLARVTGGATGRGLTPSERRVAELAAQGMTNRAIATTLFVSPSTVNTNLVRVYRKLGVHSRAELAHRLEMGG